MFSICFKIILTDGNLQQQGWGQELAWPGWTAHMANVLFFSFPFLSVIYIAIYLPIYLLSFFFFPCPSIFFLSYSLFFLSWCWEINPMAFALS